MPKETRKKTVKKTSPAAPVIFLKLLNLAIIPLSVSSVHADFTVSQKNGRIEIKDKQQLVFGWQTTPISNPAGGAKFKGSAFIHPLCTPSGFQLTRIQPSDHKHHFGVWWPWKFIKVDDKKFNTWEIQQGQGRHVGVEARLVSQSADTVTISLTNQSEIKLANGTYQPVILEHSTLRFFRLGKDAYILDIHIQQQPADQKKVIINQYRYSGFSWRGTSAWNKTNSRMHTSGGHHRNNANGQKARWAMVEGTNKTTSQKPLPKKAPLKSPSPKKASMLIMSGASKQSKGKPELLRVWDDQAHNGAPFINFNPVMQSSHDLTTSEKSVTSRRYRLILSDHAITPAEAKKLWTSWSKNGAFRESR